MENPRVAIPQQRMKSTIEIILERIDQGAATASPDGTITYANERLAAMAGAPRRSLLGTPLRRLVPRAGEFTFLRQASPLRVLVRAAPLQEGALWLFTDLSEQTAREQADERLRQFVASLGAEFGGLLAPVRRSLGALRERLGAGAEQLELEQAERGLQRLLELAERMRLCSDPTTRR